jgi:hypothetical protein
VAAAGRGRQRKLAAGVAVLAVLAVAVAGLAFGRSLLPFGAPASAKAPPSCPMRPKNVTDFRDHAFSEVYHCSTLADQAIYANPQDVAPLQEVSVMFGAADVWVICQVQGRANPVVQGRRSDWWFYTEGDTVNRPNSYGYAQAWAFLPATAVVQAVPGRPVPDVPVCPANYVVPGPPTVSSPDYPADGAPHGQAGHVGTFTFTPVVGTTDLAGFEYDLDNTGTEQFVAADSGAAVLIPVTTRGRHVLSVSVRTASGGLSPMVRYRFVVG